MKKKEGMMMRGFRLSGCVSVLFSLITLVGCVDTIHMTEGGAVVATKETRFTTIGIDGASAQAILPQGALATRAAVVMDDMFRLTEDNDFETDAYIIKADGSEQVDASRKIGYLRIKWKSKERYDKGWKLTTYEPDVKIEWLNFNGEDLEVGSSWYICGIIGGNVDRNHNDKHNVDVPLSIAFGYDKDNKWNEPYGAGGKKHLFQVPFVADWVKVNIKKKNRISFDNLSFEPQGVVFKLKIKRNEKLIDAQDHKYLFSSTGLTGNVFYSFQNHFQSSDVNQMRDVKVSHLNSVKNYNLWMWPSDQRELEKERTWQSNKAVIPSKKEYTTINAHEYRYRKELFGSENSGTEYDEFYVWGMPFSGGVKKHVYKYSKVKDGEKTISDSYDVKERNVTAVTSMYGGFMLGWLKGSNDFKDKKAVKGEFIVGDPLLNEITEIKDWNAYNGKVLEINLKVMRPGDSKYKWRVPLARFAKSNLSNENPRGFTNDITPNSGKGAFPQQDANMGIMTFSRIAQERIAPEGYRVPDIRELSGAFPYATSKVYPDGEMIEDKLEGKDLVIDNKSGVRLEGYFNEWLQLPLSDPDEKDIYNNKQQEAHLYTSIYKICNVENVKPSIYKQDHRVIVYGIRFKHNYFTKNRDVTGNRYACAYRYVIHTDDRNNDGRGIRTSVTARWIGNLPISIDEVSDDDFWKHCKKLDVVRIFNADGRARRPKLRGGIVYPSITPNKALEHTNYDQYFVPGSGTYKYRAFDTSGFFRGNFTMTDIWFPVRCISKWNMSEFDKKAPRNQKITSGKNEDFYL